MKKFIFSAVVLLSFAAMTEGIYAKPGKEKNREKREKNQKAVDAQKNWGQLKKELKNEDGEYDPEELRMFFGTFYNETKDYTDKEIKEAIKAEKVVRRELTKNKDYLPEGASIERLVNNYIYGETEAVVENYLGDMPEGSLKNMFRAREKYGVYLEEPEDE